MTKEGDLYQNIDCSLHFVFCNSLYFVHRRCFPECVCIACFTLFYILHCFTCFTFYIALKLLAQCVFLLCVHYIALTLLSRSQENQISNCRHFTLTVKISNCLHFTLTFTTCPACPLPFLYSLIYSQDVFLAILLCNNFGSL